MKRLFIPAIVLALAATPAHADLFGKAAREAAEAVMKKLGKRAAGESVETLTGRIATAAARHGDDAINAVRRAGPAALRLADDAGENAPRVLRFLSRYGDDGLRALGGPRAMTLFARYGDGAAEALVKHPGIAEPLLEEFGEAAAKALNAVGPQNGRRLGMLAGELGDQGQRVLDVIAARGDGAMEFLWKHKGVLAGGATLTAFLANPEPFLKGGNTLAETAAQHVVEPAVEAVGGAVRWLLALITLIAAAVLSAAGYLALKHPEHAARLAEAGKRLLKR